MRTIDARTQALFLSGFFATHLRVTIGSQDMTNLKGRDWVESCQYSATADKSVAMSRVALRRRDARLSLATLMDGSKLNAGGTLVDVGKAIEIKVAITPSDSPPTSTDWLSVFKGIVVKVDWAKDPIRLDCDDLGGVLERTFIEVQRVYGSDVGVDVEDVIQDILDDNSPGVTVYSITGDGGTPFKPADSPGWAIKPEYKQSKGSVMAALRTLAQQIGWEIRYLFNDNVSDWVLTFYDPGRELRARGTLALTGLPVATETFVINATTVTAVASGAGADQFNIGINAKKTCDNIVATLNADSESANLNAWRVGDSVVIEWGTVGAVGNAVVFTETLTNATADGSGFLGGTVAGRSMAAADFTFGTSNYDSLSQLAVSMLGVRNAVKVVISDAENDKIRTAITREDAASIAKYERLYMEMAESSSSQIDTISEGSTLANSALEDLKAPDISAGLNILGAFPWAELGDVYTIEANGEHFDSDQTLAMQQWSMKLAGGEATAMSLRGRPAGGLQRWYDVEGGRGAASAVDEYSDAAPSGMSATAGLASIVVEFDDPRTVDPAVPDWFASRCYVDVSGGFTPGVGNLVATGQQTRFEIHGLVPGTTYYAKVEHLDGQGNVGAISAQVSVATQMVGAFHENEDTLRVNLCPNGSFGQATLDITTNPPDRYEVAVGDWGGGAADEVYFTTADQQTGGRSVHFIGNTGGGGGGGKILSDYIPVSENEPYSFYIWIMPSAVALGGPTLTFSLISYDKDKVLIGGPTILSLFTPAVLGWQRRGATKVPSNLVANTRYVKMGLQRNAGGPASALIFRVDRVLCFKQQHKFRGYRNAAQAIASGAPATRVEFDTETYDVGGFTSGGVVYGLDQAGVVQTGRFVCNQAGEYSFTAAVGLAAVADGTAIELSFYKNAAQEGRGELRNAGAAADQRLTAAATMSLVRGDFVEVFIEHNHGANRNILVADAHDSYFMGSRTPGDE